MKNIDAVLSGKLTAPTARKRTLAQFMTSSTGIIVTCLMAGMYVAMYIVVVCPSGGHTSVSMQHLSAAETWPCVPAALVWDIPNEALGKGGKPICPTSGQLQSP